MTTNSKHIKGEGVSSRGKLKVDLTVYRRFNHQNTGTIEKITKLPYYYEC